MASYRWGGGDDGGAHVEFHNLKAEIARLKDDLDAIASKLGSEGAESARALRANAAARLGQLGRSSETVLDEIGRELSAFERETRGKIRRHPFEAILIAVGIGALVTYLLRR